MSISEIISLLGGIALFLFGMSLMGDGLKQVSGNKLEPILYRLSGTTLRGVILGTGVTAVIQSSCATAVMTVGFVNARMMKRRQAIPVILGSILGTSVTGWVICLSYIEGAGPLADLASTATLTGLVAIAAIGFRMFGKKPVHRHIGDIMMGFSVLMFGMSAMSKSVAGLGKEPWFTAALTGLSNPIVGILCGALFTALLQSASAAVGIVQALSLTGAIRFETAMPLLMGIAIGAGAPVMFSAIGAGLDGRRTSVVYPLAACIGVIFTAAIFWGAGSFITWPWIGMQTDPFSLALINSILRLVITLILLPAITLLDRITCLIIPGNEDNTAPDPGIRLEERFIAHPAVAIEQSRLTIYDMADVSEKAILMALDLLTTFDEKGFQAVRDMENTVDRYEDSLGTYLMKLTGRELTARQNDEVSEYLHTLSDFERISDHARNLAFTAQEIHEKSIVFSPEAKHELDVLCAAIGQVISMTVTAFKERDLALAGRVEPLEAFIDDLCDRMKYNHIQRLQKGICTITQGFVFNDAVSNCGRVSDHCSNVAVAMMELSGDAFYTHQRLNTLRETESDMFRVAYEEYERHFDINSKPAE